MDVPSTAKWTVTIVCSIDTTESIVLVNAAWHFLSYATITNSFVRHYIDINILRVTPYLYLVNPHSTFNVLLTSL